jgi:hypothetical protein
LFCQSNLSGRRSIILPFSHVIKQKTVKL